MLQATGAGGHLPMAAMPTASPGAMWTATATWIWPQEVIHRSRSMPTGGRLIHSLPDSPEAVALGVNSLPLQDAAPTATALAPGQFLRGRRHPHAPATILISYTIDYPGNQLLAACAPYSPTGGGGLWLAVGENTVAVTL
ncbi:MAG: hypothetical protein R3A10_19280 [Caldilineaceae bacterium]